MQEHKKTMSNWFRLNSLKQRYLAVAIALSVTLLILSYFGWEYVERVSQLQLQNVESRSRAEDALSDLITQIHSIETNLQKFITTPNVENQAQVNRAFKLFDASYARLKRSRIFIEDALLGDLLSSIKSDRDVLYSNVGKLIEVRQDESKWFPAMYIMRDKMLPNNMEFTSALDLLISEKKNNLSRSNNIAIYKLLNETRHDWTLMISEFRLLIANSFGVFSNNTKKSVENRKLNVDMYLGRINDMISRLEEFARKKNLDEVDTSSVKDIRQSYTSWLTGYREVIESLNSEAWRHDVVFLNDTIAPVISRLKQRSSNLKFELGVASAKNITDLTLLARILSNFVIILAIVITVLGLIGYFAFHQSILKPIHDFADALKVEAKGQYVDSSKFMVSYADEFKNLMSAFQDMREQVRTRESHLDHMAHHDALTGLPNRILLRDRLELAIARARRDKNMVALMFLDLDRFKQINDTLGHDIGDTLLIQVSDRLTDCMRSTDTVSRLGGDEFAIVLEGVSNAEQVASMARKLLESFELPFRISRNELHITTSIGIALGPNDDSDVDALIKDADIAMYHSKELGRNNFKFYSAEMASEVAEHMVMENQLRRAMEDGGLFLCYQPIVELKSGKIVSTEALLRWRHPEKGVIGPKQFLSILEESGLIRPVTQWILYEASNQYKKFCQAGFSEVCMSVNLSALLLKNDSIFDVIINAIEQTKIDPGGLIMEITEDTLLEDLQSSEKALGTLKSMGIRIALDDFGTGQSSLSHLRLEPIDIVKIDREFIRDIPDDQSDSELVDAVIAMAHRLHRKVIAEGVETEEQLEFLRWRKCDAVQGYFYSEPCSGDDILSLLTSGGKTAGSNL